MPSTNASLTSLNKLVIVCLSLTHPRNQCTITVLENTLWKLFSWMIFWSNSSGKNLSPGYLIAQGIRVSGYLGFRLTDTQSEVWLKNHNKNLKYTK